MAVTVALMVRESTTTTFDAVGAGPSPFSNLTPAPAAKPEPVMVTAIEVPRFMVSGLMLVTVTPGVGDGGCVVKVKLAVAVLPAVTETV